MVNLPPEARERQCLHCGSLNTQIDGPFRNCRDCRAVFRGSEEVQAGDLDIHYSLNVQDRDSRSLWCETLDVLFEAQCDIAAGLGIPPGSSFTNWFRSRQREEGVIDDPDTVERMKVISRKILTHRQFVREPYNIEAAERLEQALPRAARFLLTLVRR